MKLSKFPKTARPLKDLVAFKWIKVDKLKTKHLELYLPDDIHDGGGEGRLGHKYTCEAIAVGPDAKTIKPGDWFLLHEYDKVDQGTPWDHDEVMFVEERVVRVLLPDKAKIFIPAEGITEAMMDKYEDY